MATEVEIAWAAGFFEGEGYFSSGSRALSDGTTRVYPVVGINNTDYDMLVRFQHIVAVGSVRSRKADTARFPDAKPQWRWITTRRADVEHVFKLFEPWLSERRLQRYSEIVDDRGNLLIKTHCPRGHEYTAENTYQWNKYKWCRTCMNRWPRKRAA